VDTIAEELFNDKQTRYKHKIIQDYKQNPLGGETIETSGCIEHIREHRQWTSTGLQTQGGYIGGQTNEGNEQDW